MQKIFHCDIIVKKLKEENLENLLFGTIEIMSFTNDLAESCLAIIFPRIYPNRINNPNGLSGNPSPHGPSKIPSRLELSDSTSQHV